MRPINWSRVVLGGLLAGLVINVIEFLVNNILLRVGWTDAMRALGKPEQFSSSQIAFFVLEGFLVGVFALWLYAEIRPHYGAGPMTAVIAGLAVWLLGYLLANVPPLVMQLFPARLMLIALGAGLVEAVIGTVAGAWLYREAAQPAALSAAARL